MKNYKKLLLAHFAKYRREVLSIADPGVFPYRGRRVPKEHILVDRALNFLPQVQGAKELLDYQSHRMSWHRYAHHLNSSQVMAVNLFQPLLVKERLQILGRVTGIESPVLGLSGFEFIPDQEEKTNVDFSVAGIDGRRLSIEVKLTESDFGKPKDDDRRREKFKSLYAVRCKGLIQPEIGTNWALFRENYQFYRNALFANDKTRVWFLIPENNHGLIDLAEKCLDHLCDSIRPHVEIVTLEKLLGDIEHYIETDPQLREHYAQFRAKYAPILE